MIRLAADENFNNDIVRGILRRAPTIDIIRIQDAGLRMADDPTVLAWTAQVGWVVLTHEVATITHYAYERICAGQPMPGVFEVSRRLALAQAIDEIILNVAWKGSGKARCAICRCAEECTTQYAYGVH